MQLEAVYLEALMYGSSTETRLLKMQSHEGLFGPLCREAHMMQLEAAKSATIKRFIMWFKFIHASTFLKCLVDLTTRPPSLSSLFLKRYSGT